MKFEMNEIEKRIFEEIKNGKTEILFYKNSDNDGLEKEIQSLFFLKTFGFINGEVYSDEDKVGYVNISLTDQGYYYSMSEDEIKKSVSEKIKKLLEEN